MRAPLIVIPRFCFLPLLFVDGEERTEQFLLAYVQ